MIFLSKFCLNCLDVWEYLIRMIFGYFPWTARDEVGSRVNFSQTTFRFVFYSLHCNVPQCQHFPPDPPRLFGSLVARKRRVLELSLTQSQAVAKSCLSKHWTGLPPPPWAKNSSQCWEEISKLSKFLHKLLNRKHCQWGRLFTSIILFFHHLRRREKCNNSLPVIIIFTL